MRKLKEVKAEMKTARPDCNSPFSTVLLVDLGFWEKGQHYMVDRDHPDIQH